MPTPAAGNEFVQPPVALYTMRCQSSAATLIKFPVPSTGQRLPISVARPPRMLMMNGPPSPRFFPKMLFDASRILLEPVMVMVFVGVLPKKN